MLLYFLLLFQSVDFRPGIGAEIGGHNVAVFQAMVDMVSPGGEIELPEADVYFEFGMVSRIYLPQALTIRGAGEFKTILRFGPESPTSTFHAFYLDGDGDYKFADLTIRGPTDPGPNGPDNTLTYGIYCDAFEVGTLHLENVTISGKFNAPLTGNKNFKPGPWWWTLKNVDITGDMTAVSMYGSFPSNDLGLTIIDSVIHDVGYPGETPTAQGRGALAYTHGHVSFVAINSQFHGNRRWGNQHNGAADPDLRARQILYDRCTFFDVRVAVLASDLGHTVMRDCSIDAIYQGVNVRDHTDIIRTKITAPSVAVNLYGVNKPLRVLVDRCEFDGGVGVVAGGDGAKWVVRDTDIIITTPNSYGIRSDHTTSPTVCVVGGSITSLTNSQVAIYPRRGFWSIQGTDIVGSYIYGGIFSEPTTERVEVIGAFFDTPGKPAIVMNHGDWRLERVRTSVATLKPDHGTW